MLWLQVPYGAKEYLRMWFGYSIILYIISYIGLSHTFFNHDLLTEPKWQRLQQMLVNKLWHISQNSCGYRTF